MEVHCSFGACPELSNGKRVCELLPNCGCGVPGKIRDHYLRVLEICANQTWRELEPDSDLELLILYVLDHFGLTEHGGSVYASWTTKLGDEFLEVADKHWAKPEVRL